MAKLEVVMAKAPSKTQIDHLGNRLRRGSLTDNDLRLLDDYRRSFGEAYEKVVRVIRDELHLQPTGRPAKSTRSITEKLHRESIRLVQIQDIAGCRVVVRDRGQQDQVVQSLLNIFPDAAMNDRRLTPSYGYRAVHVIVEIAGRSVEIQVRTSLQHSWAELSEKLSDVLDPAIKYGGGPSESRKLLNMSADQVAQIEELEVEVAALKSGLVAMQDETLRKQLETQVVDIESRVATLRAAHDAALNNLITSVEKMKRRQP